VARFSRTHSYTLLVFVFCCASFFARGAMAEPNDEAATELAKQAIEVDYLGTKFAAAKKKLEQALALCGPKSCSNNVVARLHRDMGVVYVGGMGKPAEAKAEFAAALKADPSVVLDSILASEEIQAAFDDAKAFAGSSSSSPGSSSNSLGPNAHGPGATPKQGVLVHTPSTEPSEKTPPEAPSGIKKNWLSLTFQQDWLGIPGAKNTCSGGNDYVCFDGDAFYAPIPYDKSGGELAGGLALATSRIMLG